MPTTPNPGQGRREWNIAVHSLAAALGLRDMLAANPLPDNDYYNDALAAAIALVEEMDRNLEDVTSRYTARERGLA